MAHPDILMVAPVSMEVIIMKKLEVSDAQVMSVAIRQEIERSEEARYDHRLHGVLLVAKGMSARQAALWLEEGLRTVQRWVNRFEANGFAGLREGERPGRPRRLEATDWQRLGADLRKSPREFGFMQNLWDGKLLAEHLRVHYGIGLGVRQCQRIFGQMNFRLRKPRPQIAKADPAVQAAFKKTPRPRRRSQR
jgi:transposase